MKVASPGEPSRSLCKYSGLCRLKQLDRVRPGLNELLGVFATASTFSDQQPRLTNSRLVGGRELHMSGARSAGQMAEIE